MKPRVAVAVLLLLALGAPSCAIYQRGGFGATRERITRKVWLTEENFRVVEPHAEGYARCWNLLLIPYPVIEALPLPLASGIPLGNPHLLERGMADLHEQVEMEGRPRVLHNIIVEYYVVTYLGLFGYTEARISGEVIEFTSPEPATRAEGRKDG
jgi:hypothetical protein